MSDGFCQCGCGAEAPIATKTNSARGIRKGDRLSFVSGHNMVGIKQSPEWIARRVKRGAEHHAWSGGRKILERGYIGIKLQSDHPLYWMADCNGYIKEHRLIIALAIGRSLLDEEVVHHINGDVTDNRIDNLMLFSSHSEHMIHHHAKRRTNA